MKVVIMSEIGRITTHTIQGHHVESRVTHERTVLIRTPQIFPVTARDWHGPFHSLEAALADFAARIAPPRITHAALESAKRLGTYLEIGDTPTVLACCRWTGDMKRTRYVLIDGICDAGRETRARAILDTDTPSSRVSLVSEVA